ncbi:HNH endonuclease [Candidatus Falkowbacteria bacterium CG_4_10_14_0_2_um_filter_36_22]|uniref:HNH endonuclease n=1 Tax=Candidatus Falkowbacteria bacterium CG02_land_8_20_14_3_00_36_14 TaxID=1974560 RepID=A0A2M7DKE0_9BACT|nr:MAG: HNH endonuclease [Candidatus Falkowbacteria bacterium CG02_land_8_20_14_3_00_36_14]PIX12021.1 MAG: HNH endonuclease [Candidatus Falkowbacteria bacterium CG_4_8_14_3_um_filter_36_11]PJA11146.1 MAG: HNH endonuclease [Candidatus Falkowbacteria bacterium CG_4_10_14_0_2_um_filter_36_22]
MKIELKKITVRELTNGFEDNDENGVVGYGKKLDIRPPYQREFIYKDKQRDAVIDTITKNFPLNVMYWAVREDGNFEVIDGQQRTISACQYVNGDFSVDGLAFHNLTNDKKEQILNYELTIYFCSGADSEKLEWFKIINIAGERLTDQELRNAVYSGSWVSDAKRYFSKNGCAAYGIGSDYLNGSPIRQEYLETAINWISKGKIEDYMSKHQHDQNASALWRYFQDVMTWVSTTFTKKRRFMKGVEWGTLYNTYKDEKYNTKEIEKETERLILDDDVTKKSGIYPYILTRNEKYLSIRAFSDATKQKVYEKQKGVCVVCKEKFEIEEMEADHITPWHEGGKTIEKNCQLSCKECNRRKSGK